MSPAMLSGLRNPMPRPPREPEPKKKSTMKKIACIIATGIALAFAASQFTSCAGTITSPYTGNSYDFTIKPRPVVTPAK
jgi:hypothetical protein